MRAKLKMVVMPDDSKTLAEITQSGGLNLRDGAESTWGIRMDGIPKAPDNYYHQKDLIYEYHLM